MRRLVGFVLVGLIAMVVPSVAPRAFVQAPAPPLQRLSWLAGHWTGVTSTGQHIEEMWMPSRDGLMLGSFRWERGGGQWLFEFMSLDTGPPPAAGPLTLRLKHFDRGLRGMEEKGESTTFSLVEQTASRVVFEMKEDGQVIRLVYALTAADALLVTFDETEPGRPATHLEFPYTRVR